MAGTSTDNVKILGVWASPFVMRPCFALNLKNVHYEFVTETMQPKSELLLQSNPVHKKIPVMIHNNNPICESLIIVQYIDEAFKSGSSILPSDAYDRAMARFWGAYIDDKWFGSLKGTVAGKTEEEKETAAAEVVAGVGLLEEAFQKLSKGKGFFGGETIGYVDIVFGSCLGWLRVNEKLRGNSIITETTTPGLHGWADRFCAHPAVKDVMPETDKLLEFAKMRFATQSAPAAAPK